MAKARKDHRGRALRKGEIQRKDKSYMYTYTDPYGKRRYIYANDLVELREKEKRLMKDQLDGLDVYAAGNADLNFVFDRYITTKTELRRTTYTNYTYMYDRFVRDDCMYLAEPYVSRSSGSASRTRDLPCTSVMVVPGFRRHLSRAFVPIGKNTP